MLDSGGNATTVDISISGNSGWSTTTPGNYLHYDYLYTNPGVTANWALSGLEIGQTYSLYFYGNLNATYTASAGIEEGTVSASITSGALMTLAAPGHGDWVSGTHCAVIRVTPTATSVSGTYTGGASQSVFSGLQIVPVPSVKLGNLTPFTGGSTAFSGPYVLKMLREKGVDGETIVFFCSDNGAANRWEGRFDSSGALRRPPAPSHTLQGVEYESGERADGQGTSDDQHALGRLAQKRRQGLVTGFEFEVTGFYGPLRPSQQELAGHGPPHLVDSTEHALENRVVV